MRAQCQKQAHYSRCACLRVLLSVGCTQTGDAGDQHLTAASTSNKRLVMLCRQAGIKHTHHQAAGVLMLSQVHGML